MKKYLIMSFVTVFVVAGRASAADDSVAAPAFSWEGGYAGLQVGGVWSDTDIGSFISASGERLRELAGAPFNWHMNLAGFSGGVYAGWNFDIDNSNFILGIETDLVGNGGSELSPWSKVDTKRRFNTVPPVTEYFHVQVGVRQKWSGATRLRAAFAFDRWLPYVSAGVAYAGIDSVINFQRQYGEYSPVFSDRNSDIFTGWTVGVGSDYAVTDKMLLRLEYRYSDYGDKSYTRPFSYTSANGAAGGITSGEARYTIAHKTHDLRVGIAYKF